MKVLKTYSTKDFTQNLNHQKLELTRTGIKKVTKKCIQTPIGKELYNWNGTTENVVEMCSTSKGGRGHLEKGF